MNGHDRGGHAQVGGAPGPEPVPTAVDVDGHPATVGVGPDLETPRALADEPLQEDGGAGDRAHSGPTTDPPMRRSPPWTATGKPPAYPADAGPGRPAGVREGLGGDDRPLAGGRGGRGRRLRRDEQPATSAPTRATHVATDTTRGDASGRSPSARRLGHRPPIGSSTPLYRGERGPVIGRAPPESGMPRAPTPDRTARDATGRIPGPTRSPPRSSPTRTPTPSPRRSSPTRTPSPSPSRSSPTRTPPRRRIRPGCLRRRQRRRARRRRCRRGSPGPWPWSRGAGAAPSTNTMRRTEPVLVARARCRRWVRSRCRCRRSRACRRGRRRCRGACPSRTAVGAEHLTRRAAAAPSHEGAVGVVLVDDPVDHAADEAGAPSGLPATPVGVDRSFGPGGDEDLLVTRVGQRCAGAVGLAAAAGRVGRGRQVRVAPHAGRLPLERGAGPTRRRRGPGRRPRCSGRWRWRCRPCSRSTSNESNGGNQTMSWPSPGPRSLVADVGGDDAAVGEEPAAVVLGVVGARPGRSAPACRPRWPRGRRWRCPSAGRCPSPAVRPFVWPVSSPATNRSSRRGRSRSGR